MQKYLCIDIGNTRWKAGIFDKKGLLSFHSFTSEEALEELSALLYNHKPTFSIFSTVKAVDVSLCKLLEKHTTLLRFDHNTPLPIINKYQTPQTLGLDRLAAVMGVFGQHSNTLVIDAGTCITYDLLIDQHTYIGGNISPGLDMRYKALNTFTDKLPRLSWKEQAEHYGKTTEEAIQNGVFRGLIHEIEGFINHFSNKYSPLTVILTGGDSKYLVESLKNKIFVRSNLVLDGLSKILIHNVNEN